MCILCPVAPRVNPGPVDDDPAALALDLAYLADLGPDDDSPSTAAWFEETGYSLGLQGVEADVLDAFPGVTPHEVLRHGLDFSEGLDRGRRVHARQAGYRLGLGGQFCDRPDEIPERFGLAFDLGWQAGADLWADREAIMRGWSVSDLTETWNDSELAECGRGVAR